MTTPGCIYRLFRNAGSKWLDDNATRLAAAVAFYAILSLAPLFVLAVSLAGLVFGEEAARGGIVDQIRDTVGEAGAQVIETTLANAKKPGGSLLASGIGIIVLLVGASGVFNELHDALNTIWNVKAKPGQGLRQMARERFLSFGMVPFGWIPVADLVNRKCRSCRLRRLSRKIHARPANAIMGRQSRVEVSWSSPCYSVLFFGTCPMCASRGATPGFGAVMTALLFTVGKFLIGVYLATAAVGSPFGAAGSLVALVVWIYYSALIVFFGAELTQEHASQSGRLVEPIARAEWGQNDTRRKSNP